MRTPDDTPEVQISAERMARLPGYVVGELDRLSRLARAAITAAEGRAQGNAVLDPYSRFPTPLGTDPTIKYQPDPNRSLTVRCLQGELIITATGRLADALTVRPQSGNVVRISAVDWS